MKEGENVPGKSVKAEEKIRRPIGRPSAKASDGADDPRLKMLNVAAELLAEVGGDRISIAMVAKRSGYTPAAVCYHFKNRGALLDEVVRLRLLPLVEFIWGALDMGGEDPVEVALEVARRIFAIGSENPWLPSVWLTEIIAGEGLLKKRMLASIPRDRLVAFASLLEQGQKDGRINPLIDPRLVFPNLLGMTMLLLGVRSFWGILSGNGGPLTEEAALRHTGAMLRYGLYFPVGQKSPVGAEIRGDV